MSLLLSWIFKLTVWIFELLNALVQYIILLTISCIINFTLWKLIQLIIYTTLVIIFYISWVPIDITVDMKDVGYNYLRRRARKRRRKLEDLIEEVNESRDIGEIPAIYPNGWIALMESRDLAIGQATPVDALGHQFVIFRGESGKAYILDAYCPHLGAHLGVNGKVCGDCVECPFHGWQFAGEDGSCVKIPYNDKVPKFQSAKCWTSCEQNGFIYVWYHAEGIEPSWYPPVIPEVNDGSWYYRGRTQHTVNCHIQEIPENGADIAHFNQIHNASIFSRNYFHPDKCSREFCKHEWEACWEQDRPPNQHMTTLKLVNNTKIFGRKISWLKVTMDVKQIGPAIVHLHLHSIFGKGVFIQNITPKGALRQKIIHHLYAPNRFPQILARILLITEGKMLERDIAMWNNKKFMKSPCLVTEDKYIQKFRRWYAQFYSENSPKLNDRKTLNW